MGLDPEFGKKDALGLSAYCPHQVKMDQIYRSHAMLVVGYSDQFKGFKLVNSWGEGWGVEIRALFGWIMLLLKMFLTSKIPFGSCVRLWL